MPEEKRRLIGLIFADTPSCSMGIGIGHGKVVRSRLNSKLAKEMRKRQGLNS